MAKRLTLAQQLSFISEPTPQDFDPEDSYATYSLESNKDETTLNLDPGRAEYLPVGQSQLRKKGEAVYDIKYQGKRASRKDLELESDQEDEQDEGEEEEESEEDEEDDDFEDLETSAFLDGAATGSDSQDDEEGNDNNDDDDDEEMPPPALIPSKKSSLSKKSSSRKSIESSSTTKEQDEQAMMSQLKTAASADVQKGRDVKKQLAFCDNVLESRIKIQKAVTAINSLPPSDIVEAYFSHTSEELAETLTEVESLNEALFSLRQDLLKTNEQIELPAGFGTSRKRKRGTAAQSGVGGEEYLTASLLDLVALEAQIEPYLRATVTKWSDKVLSASGLALSSSKKFKAVNQNVIHAIDHSLAPSEQERLVKRTRVRRSTIPVIGKKAGEVLEGEKEVDVECFDDGDFYQQMLRDVVESRMLDLDDSTLASLRLASARGKKSKKVVDTRASKGRKIRYHVHEKVQNFMTPIEIANGWHDEQVDELFASLLGRSFPTAAQEDEAETETRAESNQIVAGGALRIFG